LKLHTPTASDILYSSETGEKIGA